MDSTLQILKRLNDSGVEYVLIGQMAAIAHGSLIGTGDIDICVAANQQNFSKIVEVLMDARPCDRMRPDKPPLDPNHPWLRQIKNLYIRCDLGQLDVLGELPVSDRSMKSNIERSRGISRASSAACSTSLRSLNQSVTRIERRTGGQSRSLS